MLRIRSFTILSTALLLLAAPAILHADVPREISYQGRLTGGGTGPVDLVLKFYDAATGGNELWSEQHNGVVRTDDLFTLNIGSQTTGGIPDAAVDYKRINPNAEGLWLGVSVNNDPELTPRTRLVMVPFAAKATTAEGLVRAGTFERVADIHSESDRSWLLISAEGAQSDNPGLTFVNQTGQQQCAVAQQSDQLRLIDLVNGVHAECIWTLSGDMYLPRGYLGIGTSSPNHPLDVEGTIRSKRVLAANNGYQTTVELLGSEPGTEGGTINLYNGGHLNTAVLSGTRNTAGGGHGALILRATDGDLRVLLDADEGDGGSSLKLRDSSGVVTIELDADVNGVGKIVGQVVQITGGSDLAEPFAVAKSSGAIEAVKPGMVVVIDPDNPGRLKLATEAYDRKVAGIISGANGLQPGMVMKAERGLGLSDGAIRAGSVSERSAAGRTSEHPVALTGRVWCWCDASYGPIQPGDRLTTSNTPGHAMKVTDNDKAPGAVIGKAMTRLAKGRGQVLVLVNLQ